MDLLLLNLRNTYEYLTVCSIVESADVMLLLLVLHYHHRNYYSVQYLKYI